MMDFSNRSALITGAAAGIGKATAIMMAKRGASLMLVDIDGENLKAVAQEIAALGATVIYEVADIADETAVNRVCARAEAELGKIDILVNNAALFRRHMPFLETTPDMWRQFIDVNIYGTLYFTKALLGGMVERKYGRVINVGSVAGVYGLKSMADYSLTKGAVIAFTRALAKEVVTDGVTVNCVSPGSVSDRYNDPTVETGLSHMGRCGTHDEYASLICFLAGEEATYISGQNYQVDGARRTM
mgnify:CR=1 FL=1